ncbi:MAG: MFS transporter [Pseudomonadota bacterium]
MPANNSAPPPAAKLRGAFTHYLSSSALWMAGMSLYGFLFNWLLVGVLEISPERVGVARAIAETGPLLVLLIGGVLADRFDGRRYLLVMHGLMALPALAIAFVHAQGALSYAWVVAYGAALACIQAMSDPARQAVLSRVTPIDIQRSVTVMTIVTSLAGIAAFQVGGQLETLGLILVLVIQAALFASGALPVGLLPALPPDARPGESALQRISGGFAALRVKPLLSWLIALNFVSALFNAGAYIVGVPFIVKEVYAGGAELYAQVMIVFTVGSIASNALLYLVMPLARPGRLFLLMQLTRIVILALLFGRPSLWLFYLLILAWGLNMGVTTTMVRAIVQEESEPETRARVLSILLLSFLVSSAVSAPLLGVLIGAYDPLTALLPGIVVSLLIFGLGLASGRIWGHVAGEASARAEAN